MLKDSVKKKLNAWTVAIADCPVGVQHVFHDVFTLVAEEKKQNLVYGVDYTSDGNGACLVNAAGNLLVVGGGPGVPAKNFTLVVSLFDEINALLRTMNVNTDHRVSPLAAEIFLKHFPELPSLEETPVEKPYREPSDKEMEESLADLMSRTPTVEEVVKDDSPL